MKQQVTSQSQKETTMLPKNNFLQHTAVQAAPEHKRVSANSPDTHFAHDFSQTTVRPYLPMVGQNYGTTACPVFPRTCPFGGACHKCPAKVSANANGTPSVSTHGGLNA